MSQPIPTRATAVPRASHGPPSTSTERAARNVREALAWASSGLVDREVLIELVALAAVAGEHLLCIGPPGTAKSEAVRRITRALGGTTFEYLLGRFTEPSEIFGPIDLRKLQEGRVETETHGMLPEADIAFLDEIFLGSTAIANTLLGVLNERVYRRGHTEIQCPLRVCVGASNALPDDPALAAFADRFLVHVFVEPTSDARLEDLLDGSRKLASAPPKGASFDDVEALAAAAAALDLAPIRDRFAHAIRLLRKAGIPLSDRRIAKGQKLVAAAAVLAGRAVPTGADLFPLVYVAATLDAQETARAVLRDLLAATENATLPNAAEEASAGPLARAARLGAAATLELDRKTEGATEVADRALRLEALAREIRAGFSDSSMPESLRAIYMRIAEALG